MSRLSSALLAWHEEMHQRELEIQIATRDICNLRLPHRCSWRKDPCLSNILSVLVLRVGLVKPILPNPFLEGQRLCTRTGSAAEPCHTPRPHASSSLASESVACRIQTSSGMLRSKPPENLPARLNDLVPKGLVGRFWVSTVKQQQREVWVAPFGT